MVGGQAQRAAHCHGAARCKEQHAGRERQEEPTAREQHNTWERQEEPTAREQHAGRQRQEETAREQHTARERQEKPHKNSTMQQVGKSAPYNAFGSAHYSAPYNVFGSAHYSAPKGAPIEHGKVPERNSC